jgi:hypothetical protein
VRGSLIGIWVFQNTISGHPTSNNSIVGLISEEIDFFVLASLAMKLREYTRNTPIRRNPVSKF